MEKLGEDQLDYSLWSKKNLLQSLNQCQSNIHLIVQFRLTF